MNMGIDETSWGIFSDRQGEGRRRRSTTAPLLVGAAVAGPEGGPGAVGGAGGVGVEAQSGLDAGDGAVGVDVPLLVVLGWLFWPLQSQMMTGVPLVVPRPLASRHLSPWTVSCLPAV